MLLIFTSSRKGVANELGASLNNDLYMVDVLSFSKKMIFVYLGIEKLYLG